MSPGRRKCPAGELQFASANRGLLRERAFALSPEVASSLLHLQLDAVHTSPI
jgi:hypothetical protein